MSRIVVNVQPLRDGKTFHLSLVEPAGQPEGRTLYPMGFKVTHSVPAGFRTGVANTQAMGAYLAARLRSHPAVSQALNNLQGMAPGAALPLYIQMTPEADGVPWETLYDAGSFLALDPRWPIARMGAEAFGPPHAVDFQPPLRVMAVLAADGVQAAPEWDPLFTALKTAPFPVVARALVAEPALRTRLRRIRHAHVKISADFVPPARELIGLITEFQPHVLHFFCHGSVANGFPHLQVATRASWPVGGGADDVILAPKDLSRTAGLESLLLLVLNACRTGQAPAGGVGSLISSVLSQGFPAVVGMREAVSESDAHAFTRGFYPALMAVLSKAAALGQPTELDLASALYEPRMEICHANRPQAAAVAAQWTLPILYVQPRAFAVHFHKGPARGAPQPEKRTTLSTKLRVLRDLVADPPPGTPEAALTAFREEIGRIETRLFSGSGV